MVHLLRTHSTISKKMVIIPNTPSNEEIEEEMNNSERILLELSLRMI